MERDLPRIPETLEEVSGNRALRNFARKVFGMIFSMVFAMFYVMCSGMSFGMVFGMIGMSLGMFFGMIRSNFGMFCSMFGNMFCSMFGSMFCSMLVNMFLNMFGWMVKEVVMIQCGGAASILEIAALRGSRFISSLAGFVCLLLLGPWAFPRVAVAATSPATNVARCAAEKTCVRRKFQHCKHYCRPCIDRWSGERWLADHDRMGEADVQDLPGWTLLELKED